MKEHKLPQAQYEAPHAELKEVPLNQFFAGSPLGIEGLEMIDEDTVFL